MRTPREKEREREKNIHYRKSGRPLTKLVLFQILHLPHAHVRGPRTPLPPLRSRRASHFTPPLQCMAIKRGGRANYMVCPLIYYLTVGPETLPPVGDLKCYQFYYVEHCFFCRINYERTHVQRLRSSIRGHAIEMNQSILDLSVVPIDL